MSIHIGREAVVENPLKNNLRCFPQIDKSPYVEIDDNAKVLVLDGPVKFKYQGADGKTIDIPYWSVQVLAGKYKDMVGWMAETNQSGITILVGQ